MMKLILGLFCLCGMLGNAVAATESGGDSAVVIVVKDPGFAGKLAGLLTAEESAAVAAVPGNEPVEEQLSAIWNSFQNWLSEERFQLLVLGAGLLCTYVIAWLINWFIWNALLRLCRRSQWRYDDLLCEKMRAPTMLLLCSIGVFLSSFSLFRSISAEAMVIWKRGFAMMVAISVVWAIYRLIDLLDAALQDIAKRDIGNVNALLADLIRKTLKAVLVLMAVFFIGQSILGLNITALLAGAGVAGLAVAFAAQDTLANFFGSITIILDKPFSVGDRVKMNNVDAEVVSMGLRSTRLRGLDGNLYTVPNRQFADNVIENVSRRPFIKAVFDIGLVYETTAEEMVKAKQIVTGLLDRTDWFQNEERPPRVHFTSFGAYSLNLSVVVWFNTTDFFTARDWQEQLNLQILARFNEAKLGFAFPSQTIYVNRSSQIAIKQGAES